MKVWPLSLVISIPARAIDPTSLPLPVAHRQRCQPSRAYRGTGPAAEIAGSRSRIIPSRAPRRDPATLAERPAISVENTGLTLFKNEKPSASTLKAVSIGSNTACNKA